MGDVSFMKAQHALAEAALRAGCKMYCGYPITPIVEVTEYFIEKAPKWGAVGFMAESEIEGGNYAFGAAAAGSRVMCGSTGVGMSLMSESISNMALFGLPVVFAHWPRSGPGTGALSLSTGDYFQATKACGHGDFQMIVLAPASVQDVVDMTFESFEIGERLRTPVCMFTDYNVALSMEVVEFPDPVDLTLRDVDSWAINGDRSRSRRFLRSPMGGSTGGVMAQAAGGLAAEDVASAATHSERVVWDMFARYKQMEPRAELNGCDGAEVVVVAFGSIYRMVESVAERLREEGLPVGTVRAVTLYPFPDEQIRAAIKDAKVVLAIECSAGQMVQDVRLAVEGAVPVQFYGRPGGAVPTLAEIEAVIRGTLEGARAGNLVLAR
jgi:2-oxoglutarate ferredoxin oxidoreductase subunit alpha